MNNNTYLRTFVLFWPATLVIGLVVWLIFDLLIAASFLLGATVSIMLMSHNYKTITQTMEKDPTRVQKVTVRNYFLRYGLYMIILAVAGLHDNLNLIVVFLGLLMFKAVMLVNFALSKKGEE